MQWFYLKKKTASCLIFTLINRFVCNKKNIKCPLQTFFFVLIKQPHNFGIFQALVHVTAYKQFSVWDWSADVAGHTHIRHNNTRWQLFHRVLLACVTIWPPFSHSLTLSLNVTAQLSPRIIMYLHLLHATMQFREKKKYVPDNSVTFASSVFQLMTGNCFLCCC